MVRKFCDYILPELKDDEVLVSLIVARKKYCVKISRSEEMLDRKVFKDIDSDYIIRGLRKFCFVDNVYIDYNFGTFIPIEAMAVYIDLTPRSTVKAYYTFIDDMNKWQYQAVVSDSFDIALFKKIGTKLFSAIAKSVSRKMYILIDIDRPELLPQIVPKVEKYILWTTKTRGGFHLICDRDSSKVVFTEVKPSFPDGVEIFGKTIMTPIPGTLQGGVEVIGGPDLHTKYI